MDRNSLFYEQVQLLLRVLPFVAQEPCFALKGGTAINLFVREFPRLSVDIDLVFLPSTTRQQALESIKQALDRISLNLSQSLAGTRVTKSYQDKADALRLTVQQSGVFIQIELSPVLRGTVFPVQTLSVCESVEDEFGFAEMQVVSIADLYAGKLCAAFDRQHPRDFFDVLLLLENEGITEHIRQAFLAYLFSHPRPLEELLAPRWKDIQSQYLGEFSGMTKRSVTIEELEQAAVSAHQLILSGLTDCEKELIVSIYGGEPQWENSPIGHIQHLPAVNWKLINIAKMPKEKREASQQALMRVLGL